MTKTTTGITSSMNASHPGAHPQHHHDYEAQRENVAEDRNQAGGPQFIQGVDVGGDASDHAAHRIAVVVGNVEALQVLHQFAAQIEHGELAGTLHQIGFRELAQESDHNRGEIERRDLRESGPDVGGEPVVQPTVEQRDLGMLGVDQVTVDGQFGEQRPDHLRHRLRQQESERDHHRSAIGPEVADQPPHQTAVVGFTEDFFFHRVLFLRVAQMAEGFGARESACGAGRH